MAMLKNRRRDSSHRSGLIVRQLGVAIDRKQIIRGVTIAIKPGEVHVLMGPNGSGKSTLASAVMGHPDCRITGGGVSFNGQRLIGRTPDERARLGLFLAFQYPVEISGLSQENFLRTAYRTVHPKEQVSVPDFHLRYEAASRALRMQKSFADRAINEGFSGGEKKKSEILQLMLLQPKLVILDEPDSGLDIDALRIVAQNLDTLRQRRIGVLVITHYFRILRYLKPDHVHVMIAGRLVRSGRRALATEVERRGFGWLTRGKGV